MQKYNVQHTQHHNISWRRTANEYIQVPRAIMLLLNRSMMHYCVVVALLLTMVRTDRAFVFPPSLQLKASTFTSHLHMNTNPWRIPDSTTVPSLIEETLEQMNNIGQLPAEYQPLNKEERMAQRRSVQNIPDVPLFSEKTGTLLRLPHPTILQINIGLYCNQACHHCHGVYSLSVLRYWNL
jgi:hypothetical protein